MDKIDFPTSSKMDEMAAEIVCLKSLVTLMLKALGHADGGKIILQVEKLTSEHDNKLEAEVFQQTIQQVRKAYRQ